VTVRVTTAYEDARRLGTFPDVVSLMYCPDDQRTLRTKEDRNLNTIKTGWKCFIVSDREKFSERALFSVLFAVGAGVMTCAVGFVWLFAELIVVMAEGSAPPLWVAAFITLGVLTAVAAVVTVVSLFRGIVLFAIAFRHRARPAKRGASA
jgi:hypothetical protein